MKILALSDGSKWGHKAAMHAMSLAKKDSAGEVEVVLFSVLDKDEIRSSAFYMCSNSGMCYAISDHEKKMYEDQKASITADFEDIARQMCCEGVKCSSKTVDGNRLLETEKELKSGNYSLILMGAYGKRSNHSVGSFYADLAKITAVPILLIN